MGRDSQNAAHVHGEVTLMAKADFHGYLIDRQPSRAQ